MWYFKKELPNNPIWIEGVAHRFDILATEDEHLAKHLSSASKKKVGGVESITKAEYDELLKKKAQQLPFSKPKFQREEVHPSHKPNLLRKVVAAPAGVADGKTAQETILAGVVPQDNSAFIPKAQRGVLS